MLEAFSVRFALGDVIVGAALEAQDAIDLVGSRPQGGDRNATFFTPQRSDDVVTVDARKTKVENEEVGRTATGSATPKPASRTTRATLDRRPSEPRQTFDRPEVGVERCSPQREHLLKNRA
jgi:hypothetical protein